VIDPGPDVEDHVRALASAVRGAEVVSIVLTHGHADHAGAVAALAAETGAAVYGPAGVTEVERTLGDGDSIVTDDGTLVAVHTPGHTPEHLCYHWLDRNALFAGDHLLGSGDTTWVAEYPGCVADYLASLERLRTIDLEVIYPAHGPPLEDPASALDRYERHRRYRIRQVEEALERHPGSSMDELLDAVYGSTVPASMRGAARRSLVALVEHVNARRDRA
jgi:glyoxylase-like metal-dependent hydrolase (beta-lactamase superfamily II)